jgi:hypothetical protein
MAAPFAAPRLRRLAHHAAARTGTPGGRRADDGHERCELCAETLDPKHRHLLDVRAGELSCACHACALLFDRKEAGRAHYRLLPRRRSRLADLTIDDMLWAGLGIPVDLAFFTRAEASGEVSVGYPSPLGTTRSTVDPDTWRELSASHPALSTMADDVEALLVDRTGDTREHWLVPLDDCYRLVAVVRAHWKGLGGGPDVWRHVGTFFSELSVGSDPESGTRPSTEEASWTSG